MGVGLRTRSDDGRKVSEWLTIVDEFTRECLALRVAASRPRTRSTSWPTVRDAWVPGHLRSDNGPEFMRAPCESGCSSST